MAVEEHLKIIQQGVAAWNDWREKNHLLLQPVQPDLSTANLRGANLFKADLRGANLSKANLSEANLSLANLRGAILNRANLFGASLSEADLTLADLSETDLRGANLKGANLSATDLSLADLRGADLNRANLSVANLFGADLTLADLTAAQLIETDLSHARLKGSSVYGVAVWNIKVNEITNQQNLIITRLGEPVITVDNIKVAQFIYLLLNNQEIRDVIDTITSKAVLILGRFSEERKTVLDAIRDELRKSKHNYLPIMFDFPPSANQTTVETIKTLANMARFVIADLTDARSVLLELGSIVPVLPSIAVRLIIKKSQHEYGMLDYIRSYRSVVDNTYEYENVEELIASIQENIIVPVEAKVRELRRRN